MSKEVPFYITSGIPFSRTIVVTLPNGRDWWTTSASFEVLSQIRESPDEDSTLLLDLKQYMTTTFTSPNTVTIELVMDGEDTRRLKKSGYYDMIISDVLEIDARAFVLIGGPVYRSAVVTADKQELG